MTDRRKKEFLTSGIVVLAVILAYSFRLVGRGDFYPTLFSYLRSFIYIGLYAAWGLSVRQRIVQRQVGRYLTAVSVLIIIWFTFRSAKYFIFWQPDAMRYLWYLFYLPMLFVPMLALLIAMSLGKPDSYRLPRATAALWLVSGTLLALVLTNDLHQFVFTFPVDAAVWSDTNHGYGFGYFAVIGWQVACAVAGYAVHFGHFMQNCGGFCSRFTCFYPPKSKARTALCSGHARRMDISLFYFTLFYFNYTSCSSPREDAFR